MQYPQERVPIHSLMSSWVFMILPLHRRLSRGWQQRIPNWHKNHTQFFRKWPVDPAPMHRQVLCRKRKDRPDRGSNPGHPTQPVCGGIINSNILYTERLNKTNHYNAQKVVHRTNALQAASTVLYSAGCTRWRCLMETTRNIPTKNATRLGYIENNGNFCC
jgi:hypothetical protein